MAIQVIATSATLNGPDRVALTYELRGDATVLDSGTVYFTMPYDDTLTGPQRRTAVINLIRNALRERVLGVQGIQNDFAALQTAVNAGQVHFP